MGKGFKKFKRKVLFEALLKSALLGINVCSLVFAGLTLSQKLGLLNVGDAFIPIYLLIGVLSGAVVGAVLFLFLRPNDKRVAARLDRSLNFSDRAKTMVEFRGEEGAMYELQRSDADEKLSETPPRLMKMKRLPAYVVAASVALAVAVGSLVFTLVYEPEQEVADGDEGDKIDESERLWRIEQLSVLIEEVKNELQMPEDIRTDVISELEELLSTVEQTDLEDVLNAAAATAVGNINAMFEYENTALKYGALLKESVYSEVKELGNKLEEFSVSGTNKALNSIKSKIQGDAEKTLDYKEEIEACINKDITLPDDSMKAVFDALNAKLEHYADTENQGDLEAAFDDAKAQFENILYEQLANEGSREYIEDKLNFIFKTELVTDEEPDEEDTDSPPASDDGGVEDDDDVEQDHSGGYGPGGTQLGSDDLVYDPDSRTQVNYGEIIDKYYGKITEKIVDGLVDEETLKIFEDYFNALYKTEEETDEPETNEENTENEDIENG